MTQEEVDDKVKLALRNIMDAGATPQQVADASLANGLAVAEHVAGPLAVARRFYVLALKFAAEAGLQPADIEKEVRH